MLIRDWSLITERRGASEVLPLQKGGGKGFSHAQGGGGGATLRFEIVLTQALEVLAMLKVGGGGAYRICTI